MSEYVIRVRLPNGTFNEVTIRAASYGIAKSQASAFGEVMGMIESRSV